MFNESNTGFKKLNLTSQKSLTTKCSIIRHDLYKDYWRGVLDGDGWISLGNRISGSKKDLQIGLCGSLEMMTKISELAKSVCETSANPVKHGKIYIFKIGGWNMPKKFIEYLYANSTIYLDRKYFIVDKIFNHNE